MSNRVNTTNQIKRLKKSFWPYFLCRRYVYITDHNSAAQALEQQTDYYDNTEWQQFVNVSWLKFKAM